MENVQIYFGHGMKMLLLDLFQEYVEYISSLVSNKITFSRSVQSLDYYNYLAKELGRTR